MRQEYAFGYPIECDKCGSLAEKGMKFGVAPYYHAGGKRRIMLIGQDPTISKEPERVTSVLMLDQANSQLKRWLQGMIGKAFDTLTLYATNLVKCSFPKPPSTTPEGGLRFIQPYFNNCKDFLKEELRRFAPDCVLTFGEPSHRLFSSMLSNVPQISPYMKEAFTGQFIRAKFDDTEFDYSPCLHIKTFRVAEKYGESVQRFKENMSFYFAEE
jgi:uracil-DNA glycosylase